MFLRDVLWKLLVRVARIFDLGPGVRGSGYGDELLSTGSAELFKAWEEAILESTIDSVRLW